MKYSAAKNPKMFLLLDLNLFLPIYNEIAFLLFWPYLIVFLFCLEKLGELDHADGTAITPNVEQEKQKRKEKQKKVIEELVATEKSYVENISLVTEKIIPYLQHLQVVTVNLFTHLLTNLSFCFKSTYINKKLKNAYKCLCLKLFMYL